ncbi:MAG: NYN domain-containing protein [Phycisphaerales bacterium JB060]
MLLIDTSNVLHAIGVLPEHLMGDHGGLDVPGLARLIATSRYGKRRAVLVCDGVGPGRATEAGGGGASGAPEATNTAPSGREVAGLDVVYAGAHQEADDVIELLIARDSAPRRLLVVSTDRRLAQAARRRRAQSVTSEAFLQHLASDSAKPRARPLPGYATQVPLNEYAVGYWMALFGYGDEPGQERAPGVGRIPDISEAARRGLDEDRSRKRARSPNAHEGLKIPKDLLGASGRTKSPPPLPAGEATRSSEEGALERQHGPGTRGDPKTVSEGDLPPDLRRLLKDSGLTIDPADLDMTKWLPNPDNPPSSPS